MATTHHPHPAGTASWPERVGAATTRDGPTLLLVRTGDVRTGAAGFAPHGAPAIGGTVPNAPSLPAIGTADEASGAAASTSGASSSGTGSRAGP